MLRLPPKGPDANRLVSQKCAVPLSPAPRALSAQGLASASQERRVCGLYGCFTVSAGAVASQSALGSRRRK